MTVIALKAFGGVAPKVNRRLLNDNDAQIALNAKLNTGSLTTWKESTQVANLLKQGAITTIYRFRRDTISDSQYWFEFVGNLVNVVRGPINDDTRERTYITGYGGSYPMATSNEIATTSPPYPYLTYRLGVPPPSNTIGCAVVGTPTSTDAALAETRFYVYTYVTAWGEEGPPSLPGSPNQVIYPGQSVNLSNMSTGPVEAGYNITKKYIYRTNTGNAGTEYQFVAEVPLANTTYSDTVLNAALGEVLPSSTWAMPPAGMMGLTAMANGILAGHTNNTVWLSEPYQPHAWPVAYGRTVDSQIVGLGSYGQSLVVLTTSQPWILTGTDPQSMSFEKLAFDQACMGSRTIVSTGDGVMYASPDGLCYVGDAGPKVVSEPLLTKEQWKSYNWESMMGAMYDNRYMCFYNNNVVKGCLVFSFTGVDPALSVLDDWATAVFKDPLTDALYMVRNAAIYKFDSGQPMQYTWKSKLFTLPDPVCMAAGQVIAAAYPVTFRLYADQLLKYTYSVPDSEPFRLPSGYLATDYEVQLECAVEVEQVLLSTSSTELKGA